MRLLALPTSILLFLQLFPFTTAQTSSSSLSTLTMPSPAPSSVISGSASANSSTSSGSQTASAMFPTLSGYSTCVTNCLTTSIAAANCTSVVDVDCFCKSPKFVSSIINCTRTDCPTELQTAENLSQQFCAVANPSTSLSFSITSISITSSSSGSPSSTPSQTTTPRTSTAAASPSSGAAVRSLDSRADGRLLICLGVAVIGMIMGTLCL